MGALFDTLCDEDLLEDFFTKRKWKECEVIATTLRIMWDNGKI